MPNAPLNFHFYAEAPNPYSVGMRVNMGVDLFPKGFTPEELNVVYEGLLNGRGAAGLILEGAAFADVESYYNPGWESVSPAFILEAITIDKFSRTEKRMAALARVLNKYLADNKEITALDPIVGDPKKSGSFAYVMVQMPFSDGQVVSVVFHSPEGDKKRIGPEDSLIAFRWLLNKRDITHVVAPEDGAEVSLETIGKRVTQLVEKNSARFQSTQKDAVMQQKQLDDAKAALDAANAQEKQVMDSISAAQAAAQEIDAKASAMQKQLESQKALNADLENQITALKAQQAAKPAPGVTGGDGGETSTEKEITMPEFRGWRVSSYPASNSVVIVPNKIGGKFSEDEVQSLVGWIKENGWTAFSPSATSIRIIFGLDVKAVKVGIEKFGAYGVKMEKDWEKKEQKIKEEALKKQSETDELNSLPSSDWIEKEFSAADLNLYNKLALAKFLDDKESKFKGLVDWKWAEVVKRLNALTEDEQGIDWEKLKSAYQNAAKQAAKPDVSVSGGNGGDDEAEKPLTKTTNGLTRLAKISNGELITVGYANRKQAENKANELRTKGYDVHVTASHPFSIIFDKPAPQGEQDNTTEAEVPTPGVAYFRVKKTGVDWSIFTNEGKEILAYIEKSEAVRNAEILETSRRYVGAFNKAEAVFAEDSKQQYQQVSKYAGKSVREEYLKNRYGISGAEARNLTNIETSENIPADKSANVTIEEFKGEPWADNALAKMQPAQGGSGAGKAASPSVDSIPTRVVTGDFPFAELSTTPGWVVMNAPRPIIGDKTENGDFIKGRFYAAIDLSSEFAAQNIKSNLELDAVAVIKVSQEQFEAMAYNSLSEKYRELYAKANETTRKNALQSQLDKLQNKPMSEIKAIMNAAPVPTPDPTPDPATTDTPHAVETLNAIIRGDYQGQPEQIDRLLDECADELEKAGLFDQYEGLLNQAADILTSELSEKAKAVA